jgi:hypothetical protein
MENETGTIFKVYLLDQPAKGKQEGFVQLWKHKGKLQNVKHATFNELSRIPGRIEELLSAAKIEWPPQATAIQGSSSRHSESEAVSDAETKKTLDDYGKKVGS